MRPYFADEQAGIVIYNADCREVLPELEVDRLITDPPYGTGWVKGGGKHAREFQACREHEVWDIWDPSWLSLVHAKTIAFFVPNSRLREALGLLGSYSLRYYTKSNPRPSCQYVDSPSVEPIVITPKVPFGNGPQHLQWYNVHETEHPTEKPLAVMRWLVEGCSARGEMVTDPFAGSGTTLLAAKQLGRRAIGIERSERWCEIAAHRLQQAVLPLTPRPAPAEQPSFFGK